MKNMEEQVILVNEKDEILGYADKLEAHRKGWLHRAFSIFVFNGAGELLLQQRALEKYHSGGLWTNTCCSHPRAHETLEEAAHRRLAEEMGFDCALNRTYSFIYRSALDKGLTEHEYDHVFFGQYDGALQPDPHEVAQYRFDPLESIEKDIQASPEAYTAWFKITFDQMKAENPYA